MQSVKYPNIQIFGNFLYSQNSKACTADLCLRGTLLQLYLPTKMTIKTPPMLCIEMPPPSSWVSPQSCIYICTSTTYVNDNQDTAKIVKVCVVRIIIIYKKQMSASMMLCATKFSFSRFLHHMLKGTVSRKLRHRLLYIIRKLFFILLKHAIKSKFYSRIFSQFKFKSNGALKGQGHKI